MAKQNINPSTGLSYTGNVNYRETQFQSPQTLAEKILMDTATSCSLTIPVHDYWKGDDGQLLSDYKTVTIPFYMSSEFGFSLSNEFRELVNIGDNAFIDFFNGVSAFTGGSQVTPQSEAMSSKVWRGSKFDGFNVECLFVCTNRNHNPVDSIKTICLCCLPRPIEDGESKLRDAAVGVLNNTIDRLATGATVVSKGLGIDAKGQVDKLAKQLKGLTKSMGMVAPLDYGIELSGESEDTAWGGPVRGTTVTLNVGNWFRASQLVVTSISNVSFSKEIIAPRDERNTTGPNALYKPSFAANNVMADGFPLYAKCNVSLAPSSMMHAKKFENYFSYSSNMAQKLNGFMDSYLGVDTGARYDLP